MWKDQLGFMCQVEMEATALGRCAEICATAAWIYNDSLMNVQLLRRQIVAHRLKRAREPRTPPLLLAG